MMCRSADRRRRDRNRREPIRDSRVLDHARSIHQNSGALHPRQDLTRRFGGLLITNEGGRTGRNKRHGPIAA